MKILLLDESHAVLELPNGTRWSATIEQLAELHKALADFCPIDETCMCYMAGTVEGKDGYS